MLYETKKQIMVFSLGAAALITLATTFIVSAHYWMMLSGIWLIALLGLALPDWVVWWSTYWYSKADQDTRVKVVAMLVAFAMTIVMILNAGAVLAVWWDDKQRASYQATELTERKDEAKARSENRDKSASNRSTEAQRMKAAGVSQRNIDTFLKAETGLEKEIDQAPAAQAGAPKAPYETKIPEQVQRYLAFWVYIVPFIIGLLGKFAVVAAIALPGGVDFGRRAPVAPVSSPHPSPPGASDWVPESIDANGTPKARSNRD